MTKTTQNWKIGDCLELLPSIDDKSINMILCDLPYGTTACSWDTIIPFEPLWKEWKRIITDNGIIVLTASQPFTTKLINSNMDMFKYELIWNKMIGGGFALAKKRPLSKHENILIFYKKLPIYNPKMINANKEKIRPINKGSSQGLAIPISTGIAKSDPNYNPNKRYPTSILEYSSKSCECNSLNRIHPTQKPVKLFEYLIKTYTNEGDWVHDSCLGSGTTLEACRNTNRSCLGIEISNEWEKHYNKRSMKNIPQLNNFW